MAWWTIEHSCGHTQRVQLYGPGKDRERKAEWMERGVCPDCYRAQKELEKKQESERAATVGAEIGFISLAGSEKQIAWAITIRQKVYESLCKRFNPVPGFGYTLAVEAMNLETSAKWWIDNRDVDAVKLMNVIAGNYPEKCKEINGRMRKEVANG